MPHCGDSSRGRDLSPRSARRPPSVDSCSMTNAAAVADTIESELAPIHAAVSHAGWEINVRASDENEARRIELEQALSDFLADGDRFALIEAARSRGDRVDPAAPRPPPARLPRESGPGRAPLAHHRARGVGRHASSRASRRRSTAAGSTTTRSVEILRESDDEGERREAWEASKTVGAAVADDVRELARLRNAAAHAVGYRDWFALSLALSEMDEDEADRHARRGRSRQRPSRSRAGRLELDERLAARFGVAADGARALALRRPVLPGGPGRGRSRPRPVPRERRHRRALASGRSTGSGSRRGRSSSGATCSRATASASTRSASTSTVRATCACSRTSSPASSGWTRCSTSSATRRSTAASTPPLPWLLRDSHPLVTEGIAILMGRLASDAEWLERVLGADAEARSPRSPALSAPRARPRCSSSRGGCS